MLKTDSPPGREVFQRTDKAFVVPKDTSKFDTATKRKVTICNLFAHYELPIRDIVRVLDERYSHVVDTLIAEGLVYDRRRRQYPINEERRQPHLVVQ